jgi:hypothetical protein
MSNKAWVLIVGAQKFIFILYGSGCGLFKNITASFALRDWDSNKTPVWMVRTVTELSTSFDLSAPSYFFSCDPFDYRLNIMNLSMLSPVYVEPNQT